MKALKLDFLEDFRDVGLLVMRLGLGASFIAHGWPKISGGPEMWAKLGGRLADIVGFEFIPVFWGFMAAFGEFGGGILLILGLATRPAAFLLMCTMIVAALSHYTAGDGFSGYAHPMELSFVFFGILLLYSSVCMFFCKRLR